MQAYENQIEEEITVCPYCMNDYRGQLQCCGENHWAEAYIIDGECYLADEVTILEYNKEDVKGDMQLRALKDGDL